VSGDDSAAAAATRDVDLQKKYDLSLQVVADKLGLSTNRAKPLRDFIKMDEDSVNMMVFEFVSQKYAGYSDNAMVK
jgi:hypothetical protein